MASSRLIVSTLFSSLICLAIGFFVGRSTMGDQLTPAESGESRETQLYRTQGGESAMPGAAVSAANSPDSEQQGGDEIEASYDNSVATIPVSALEILSSASVKVPGENLFDRDDAVIDALAIDDMEKATLQTAYRKIDEGLKNEEAKATEVMRNDDGTVALSVPAMEQARNSAREKFERDVISSLGEDRGKVFLAAKQHSSMFGKEGAPKDYFIEMESVGDGNFRYRVSEMEGENRRVFVGNAIPARLRHLTGVANIIPVLERDEDEEE